MPQHSTGFGPECTGAIHAVATGNLPDAGSDDVAAAVRRRRTHSGGIVPAALSAAGRPKRRVCPPASYPSLLEQHHFVHLPDLPALQTAQIQP